MSYAGEMTARTRLENETSTEPGGRAPAPGPLALLQAFVNTNDREGGRDALGSPESLRAWLSARAEMAVAEISSDQFGRAIALREALRGLAIGNAGGRSDGRALATVNAEAERTSLSIRFTADGIELSSEGGGFDRFIADLLAALAQAMTDRSWVRLKACRRDACQWVFFDRSPNESAAWCDMRICGSREKAKAYYRRRRRRMERTRSRQ